MNTRTKMIPIILSSITLFIFGAGLVLYSTNTPAQSTSNPDFTIDNLDLVNKNRVSRTDYEYTYTADITNNGADAVGTTIAVTSSSASTTIIEGQLDFGGVPGGGVTVTSSDTFTVRQDRRVGFDSDDLQYSITFNVLDLPPDPGEAGKQTLEGIDSDGDGVRDDIQRYIVLNYPDSRGIQMSLFQAARILHDSLLDAGDEEKSIKNHIKSNSSLDCIVAIALAQGEQEPELLRRTMRAEFLNTKERLKAFYLYNDKLAGHGFSGSDLGTEACDFDINELGG